MELTAEDLENSQFANNSQMSMQDEEMVDSDTNTVINLCQTPTTRPDSKPLCWVYIYSYIKPAKYTKKM